MARRRFAAAEAVLVLLLGLTACGDDDGATTPTLTPGQTLRIGSAETITQSGEYALPAGRYTLQIDCRGSSRYEVEVAGITSTTGSGVSLSTSQTFAAAPCGAGSTSTLGLTGPGTITFVISSGSIQVTLR